MRLTSENVERVFLSCLFTEEEALADPIDFIRADGMMVSVGFHPERLEEADPQIRSLVGNLPLDLLESGGSFLAMCMDRDGNQWGEHRAMDQLLCLGAAAGLIQLPIPREFWPALPGGMPLVAFGLETD